MTTRPITLRDEHEILIQQALKSGRFLSESEVVAEALSEFQVHEEIRRAKFAELKGKIQAGIDQLDRGKQSSLTLTRFWRRGMPNTPRVDALVRVLHGARDISSEYFDEK